MKSKLFSTASIFACASDNLVYTSYDVYQFIVLSVRPEPTLVILGLDNNLLRITGYLLLAVLPGKEKTITCSLSKPKSLLDK